MNALIVGCGDLGMRIAGMLLADPGNRVWAMRRHPPRDTAIPGLQWIAADLARPDTLGTLPAGITHVVYAAAPDSRTEAEYRAVYREGIEHILDALPPHGCQRVIFISSTAVYGDHGDAWVDEDTPLDPPGFNGRILQETETWLASRAAHSDGHLVTTCLRLSGIYGPGRTFLLERLRSGKAAAPAHAGHWANRVHVDDAARAVCHVLTLPTPAPVYLVTDDTPLPIRTLYEDLARLVGGPVPPVGPAPAGMGNKRLSNARLRATGFKFEWGDSRDGHAALLRVDQAGG